MTLQLDMPEEDASDLLFGSLSFSLFSLPLVLLRDDHYNIQFNKNLIRDQYRIHKLIILLFLYLIELKSFLIKHHN